MVGSLQITGLGKDRIGLPVHFLGDEVQLAPYASALQNGFPGRLDVALQANQFFVHTDLIREDRNLHHKAVFIHLGVSQKLLHLRLQILPVFRNDLRRPRFNESHMLQHAVQLSDQILLQIFSFADPGARQCFRSSPQRLFQRLPDAFLVHIPFFHGKNLREAGERGNRNVVLQGKLFRHLP